VFDNLSEKLGGILDRLTRRGALTEADSMPRCRVRRALLEAVSRSTWWRSFTERVREQAIGPPWSDRRSRESS